MKKGEIVFSGVCVAFFGFMLFETLELLGQGRPGEVGSGLWPFMAIGGFIGAQPVDADREHQEIQGGRREERPGDLSAEAIAEKRRQRTTVTLSIVTFLAYILVMPWIGFILATLIYILAFALALGERRRWVLTVSPFLVTAVIVGVFAKFITIPFPKGIGVFAEFSRLFY